MSLRRISSKPKVPTEKGAQQSYYRVQVLWRISSLLSNAYTQKKVAQIIINEAFPILGVHNGDISVIEDSKVARVIAHKGYPKDFLIKWAKIPKNTPLLMSQVIKTKRAVFIEDSEKLSDNYEVAKLFLQMSGAHSAALLPLRIKNKIIGVIQFTFLNSHKFTRDDRVFMNTLAYQCAQAFERVTALENLKESKDQLEIILKNTADGIVVSDIQGKVLFINKAAIHIFGYTKTTCLIGKLFYDCFKRFFVYSETGEKIARSQLVQIKPLQSPSKLIVQLIHKKDQNTIWLNIKTNVLFDTQRQASMVIHTLHDITQTKEADQRKDDFINMASHELRTPLTSMKLFVEVLLKHLRSTHDLKSLQYAEKLLGQTERLHMLVSDLLDITRIQKGKAQFHAQPFRLDVLLSEIVQEYQLLNSDHKIKLTPLKPLTVTADRFRIYQVVTNLITNAAKYSPPGTEIHITALKKRSQVIVTVRDFGVGISQENQKKIFERFYQVQDKNHNGTSGLGMGLYISREVIRHHNGEFKVKSKEGKGSTFSFSLPV